MKDRKSINDAGTRQASIITQLHDDIELTYKEIGDYCECEASTIWRIRKGKINNTRVNIGDDLERLALTYKLKRGLND